MTTWDGERWQAAAAELDALLDLGPDAREAALSTIFRRDASLAADVAKLLADLRSAQAERFLDAAAAAPRPAATGPGQPGEPAGGQPNLPPGTIFGGYRIRSVLGRGGMGIVYDAEEVDSGRRLALKVVEQRLDDERHRERFAREGRLAASIDHPHCVFVFGAGEIDGRPFIAMELMQGTLADRIASSGAMPSAAAVDTALGLIAGLEAAGQVGVLHRDVKPSNCFVDGDGVVKVGDFGISRLTRTAEATMATRGMISATPMYASPEQLRGDTIDVRSDIYSLGATLYELVTGRRPFDADDLMNLLMRVANDVPTAPHLVDAAMPRGLSGVILRCLAKRPEQRFASYAALAAALTLYGTVAPTPATVGHRLLAGAIDFAIVGPVSLLLLHALILRLLMAVPLPALLRIAIVSLPAVLYFGLSEGRWSCSPGKAICRLTVVDTNGRPVSSWRAWVRAACFAVIGITIVFTLARATFNPREQLRRGPVWGQVQDYSVFPVLLAVLFVTARRRNGYAALHDLATGTRVVAARDCVAAPNRSIEVASVPAGRVLERHGAFVVYEAAIEGLEGWRPGFDERLRRQVWVRMLPADAPPMPAPRAAISRPTRLRWLAGQRGDGGAWDVYESAPGLPLARACATPRRWSDVHRWLLDLTQELDARGPDDRPPLRLDRVWVLDTGHLKLLDDPTLDAGADAGAGSLPRADLVREVVRLARASATEPWPASAGRFVDALESHDPDAAEAVAPTLHAIGSADRVSWNWRSLSIGAQLALPLVLVGLPLLMQLTMSISPAAREQPLFTMFRIADALDEADRRGVPIPVPDREAMERVLASRYRMVGSARRMPDEADGRRRARVEAIARRYPTDVGVATAAARPAVKALVEIRPNPALPSLLFAAMLLYDALVKVALCALASALLARSALLRLLGFEIVTAHGPASRLRLVARTAIAWAAILGPAIVFASSGDWYVNIATNIAVVYAALVVQLTGAAIAVARPMEGLQDRLAGTWIVPR